MLIKRTVLDRIADGEVDLVFRRWRRPTVRAGGTLRTAVGMLAIDQIEAVTLTSITAADATRAGYPSKAALLRDIRRRDEGTVYRIEVSLGGADPRLALREQTELDDDARAELDTRLARLDRASRRGPWTERVLRMIAANPQVRAQELANQLELDKATFKSDVRKLKALGLTVSHSPGYELSPRGRALLAELDR